MRPYINKIPKPLKYCEELFDKDVPEIKKSFQNFEQYMNINPINIWIIDPEIQSKLLFYSKKYKRRFIDNSLLFSSSIVKDTNVIFITTNGLNDALLNDQRKLLEFK